MLKSRWLRSNAELAVLTAITMAGLALRLFRLGCMSYWFDEAISLSIAEARLGVVFSNAIQSSHPPLYYLMLKGWLSLGMGLGETTVRLPSALLSTAAIPALYATALTLFPRRSKIALISAALLAVAPFPIAYAQEARMYALQLLLVALMLLSFVRAWRDGRPRWWLLFVTAATLGIYTQYFTFLAIAGLHSAALLDRVQLRARWRALLLSDLVIGLFFAPQLLVFLGQTDIAMASDWMPPDPTYVVKGIHTLLLSYSLPSWGVAAGFFVTLSLTILATYQMVRSMRLTREVHERQASLLLLLTFWLPLGLVAGLVVVHPFFMPYRSLTVVIPSYILLLAHGASNAPRRTPVPALYALLLLLIVVSLGHYYFSPQFAKPPYRDAAELIAERAQANDAELHTSDGSYLPFLYYEQPVPVYLLSGDPGARKPDLVYGLMGGQVIEAQEALAQDRRIWLVVALEHSLEYQEEMLEWFTRDRQILQEYDVGGIRIYLLADGTPP